MAIELPTKALSSKKFNAWLEQHDDITFAERDRFYETQIDLLGARARKFARVAVIFAIISLSFSLASIVLRALSIASQ